MSGARRVLRQVARIIPEFAMSPNATRNQPTKKPTIAGGDDSVLGAWPWMVRNTLL